MDFFSNHDELVIVGFYLMNMSNEILNLYEF